jgi:hypothetical protein
MVERLIYYTANIVVQHWRYSAANLILWKVLSYKCVAGYWIDRSSIDMHGVKYGAVCLRPEATS